MALVAPLLGTGCSDEQNGNSGGGGGDSQGGDSSTGGELDPEDYIDKKGNPTEAVYDNFDATLAKQMWHSSWGQYPGDLSGLQNYFWERDSLPEDDPDRVYVDNSTYYEEGSVTATMGVLARSHHAAVIRRLDYEITYPAELLKYASIERHWAYEAIDDDPGVITDVELVEPGRLRFSYDLGEQVLFLDPNDRHIATIHFDILASGAGVFELFHPAGESWSPYGDNPNKRAMDSPIAEASPNWATYADGTGAPFRWDVLNNIVIR